MHLLYLTAEEWPTFRPDLLALFGKYLPRHKVTCDLVTERAPGALQDVPWGGGQAILYTLSGHRAAQYVVKLWHNLRTLVCLDRRKYDAIQVRDMSVTALAGLVAARCYGLPFYYWLSYPQSEGQIDRARSRGLKGGMRFWFPLIQGMFGKWLLYRLVLPRADHIFVQSRQMQLDLMKEGIDEAMMTPVPMGVDTETAHPEKLIPSSDSRLAGRRVVVYLGTLDPVRRVDILIRMLPAVKERFPEVMLLVVGDTSDSAHREWLRQEAEQLDVADSIVWTGWLDSNLAWCYVRTAEIGLSPIPRGFLLDCSSPTKAVEYMALGISVVVNDNPDQAQVVAESGAGLCVPLDESAFANAVITLLESPQRQMSMGEKGREYVARKRSYEGISRSLAEVYHAQGKGHDA